MSGVLSIFAPLGRILIGSLFLWSGVQKLLNETVFQDGLNKISSLDWGLPPEAIYGVIALEILGGLLVIIGLFTQLAALLLAGFTLVATYFFHQWWSIEPVFQDVVGDGLGLGDPAGEDAAPAATEENRRAPAGQFPTDPDGKNHVLQKHGDRWRSADGRGLRPRAACDRRPSRLTARGPHDAFRERWAESFPPSRHKRTVTAACFRPSAGLRPTDLRPSPPPHRPRRWRRVGLLRPIP